MTEREGGRVVIVGSGPAGLTAAYELGQAGIASVVLGKGEIVGGYFCFEGDDLWSMLTAMLAVENVLGASHDLRGVNTEQKYQEEMGGGDAASRLAQLEATQPLVPVRVRAIAPNAAESEA